MVYITGSLRQFDRVGRCAGLPVFCLLVTVMLSACGRPPTDYDVLLKQAETHISNLEWDQAIPDLKQYLRARPHDGRAHFQLGRCYLNGTLLVPNIAEGEFRIALNAYEKNGKKSLFKENTDQFFPIRCHLEIAKIYMKVFMNTVETNLPRTIVEGALKKLRKCAEAARSLDANNPDVIELFKYIESFSRSIDSSSPPAPEGFVADRLKPEQVIFL